MAQSQNIDMQTAQSTSGGTNLGQHWRGDKDLKTVDRIRQENFDAVVLQDHSMGTINNPDSLMKYGQLFSNLIKQKGGQVYLYMTWARRWDPFMQSTITEKYTTLAEKINARIVPVGLAWQRARELRPDLDLYDEDGSHPSTLGSYLSACVFYGVLTNQSPIGLPERLFTTDRAGETLCINIQSAQNALFCQKVAHEVIQLMPD